MIEIEINKGQNIIDIYFDDFASCLVIKKAIAVNWPDCNGSIGEYYSISNFSTEERNFHTESLNNVLSEGTDHEQFERIKAFLNLFSNGQYTIHKYTANIAELDFLQSDSVIHTEAVPENESFSGRFYPDWNGNYEPLLFSITNDQIDPDRVEHYCQLLKKGIRPTIVTFEVSNVLSSSYSRSYVLDGHHKIEAYVRLKENIPIMRIMKQEACNNKTSALLRYVKPILKDFEYQHLFENNSENILEIDFTNDTELTADLDSFLKNATKIGLGIITILKKHSDSTNNADLNWLDARLEAIQGNKNVSHGKELKVLEFKSDERYGASWFTKQIKSHDQLNEWIKNTFK